MKLHAASVTDGYKLSHGAMYADGTTKVYSNLTPRSDKIHRRNCTPFYDGKLVWVGAQGAVQEIKEMWDVFFASPKEQVVGRFARRRPSTSSGAAGAGRGAEAAGGIEPYPRPCRQDHGRRGFLRGRQRPYRQHRAGGVSMAGYIAAIGLMFSVSAVFVLGVFGLVFWMGSKIDKQIEVKND